MALTPEQLAELQRLKQMYAPLVEAQRRKDQAQDNAEKMGVVPPGKAKGGEVEEDYRGSHTAPGPHFGAPMHDVTRDMYPKDFYGPNGFRYYADFGEHHDREAYDKVRRIKDKPNEMVSIHRAIPTSVYKEALKKDAPLKHMIRPGDWVAITKQYAKEHGEGVLRGDYKIASMRVPAKHVWTNADSIHEWGYHPVEEKQIATKAKGGSIPSQDVMRFAIGGQGPKNWLKGSLDPVLQPLKINHRAHTPENEAELQAELQDATSRNDQRMLEAVQADMRGMKHGAAINQWIERNLANYIKKQMATPDDPIRKLAEQGIVHIDPEQVGMNRYKAPHRRSYLGGQQLGESEAAKAWEDATDVAFERTKVGNIGPTSENREPWHEKADPETLLYYPSNEMHAHYLGFDHIVDVLKQDLAEGRIRPEQLSKVSIEHAVRRTHEYDQERKKAMAETALKATEGMPVHKEYPEGYKWIELTLPELEQGYTKSPSGAYVSPEGEQSIHHPGYGKLEDALKYEGDTMGHCVGGYCPDVAAGKTRIFSLRDAKNEPHVTIEVQPNQHLDFNTWWDKQPKELRDEINARARRGEHRGSVFESPEYLAARAALPPVIKQIKGKANAKPKKQYIPYVQDFVKSGKWSDVGDLLNADLYHVHPESDVAKNLSAAGEQVPTYVTNDELTAISKRFKKAEGGLIHKAEGGNVQPTPAQMKLALMKNNPLNLQSIGANEAPNMMPKAYLPPDQQTSAFVPPGGAKTPAPMGAGGIDMSQQPGQQLMSQGMMPQQQAPQGAPAPQGGQGQPPDQQPQQPGMNGNILEMTKPGRALNALNPSQAPGMADGGEVQGLKDGNQPKITKRMQTVKDPLRMAYPGIYQRPDVIAAMAASRVAPEDPALKQLFGVTREDLYQMSKGRQGNLPGALPGMAAQPRGSEAAARVTNPRNTQRLIDVMAEAEKHPELVRGMDPWYVMDPLFQRLVQLIGLEQAKIEYPKMNTLMGMASPGSEVNTEIPRGTAAYYLQKHGRFEDFLKHAGTPEHKRGKNFPADIRNVPGHAYHKTAQATPMAQYLESGQMEMKSPKVPMYIEASGVPETGYQTATPVGDAHWSRAVGLADVRGKKTIKGKEVVPGASVSNPEMAMLAPWWRENVASKLGLESVPAQARAWGAFSPQTGVTTPIGAPKLELIAKQIMQTAKRMGVSPETARNYVLTGKTYAGKKKGGKVNTDAMRLELTKSKKAK